MRLRESADVSPSVATDVVSTIYTGACSGPGTTTVTHSIGSNVRRSFYRKMEDVVTPNFQKCVSEGRIINNPMTYLETEDISECASFFADLYVRRWNTSCNPDNYTYTRSTYQGTKDSLSILKTKNASFINVPTIDVERLTSLAITEAWAKVGQCDLGTLEALAEFRETVTSLRQLLRHLYKFLTFVRLKHWFMVRQYLTASQICDRYMEARYVLRPLIYDIVDFYKQFTSVAKKIGERQTFRGWESDEKIETSQVTWSLDSSGTSGVDHQRVISVLSSKRTVGVRSGVLAVVESSSWLDRWGFDNVLETMWECMKFSHVIDWVLNVGKTIAAHTPEAGLRALASWYVLSDESYQFASIVDSQRWFTPATSYSAVACALVYGGCTASKTVISRSRVPNPRLDILPTIDIRLDVWKIADLLVMIKHLLGK